MKALKCELCGSNDVVKQDGLFVCQHCGTKYSVEEAKKMMVEGTVDVKGTVKVDTSDELKNLYEIARRAKDSDNSENAAKYYDMILVKDPSSWEANFYVVYYKAMSCTIGQISSAGSSVTNCLSSVIDIVESNVAEDEKENVLKEIQARCSIIAHVLSSAAESTYLDTDIEYRTDYIDDFSDRVLSATFICYTFGDVLEEKYQGKYGTMSAESWKDGIEVFQTYTRQLPSLTDVSGIQKLIDERGEMIKKYDPSYVTPSISSISSETPSISNTSSSGCYVATAVYGSYNCPEVWTLRRFRDNTLDTTWYGRAFIQTYYAISPTLVKWFGDTSWFKKLWRRPLDKMVAKLKSNGVEDTPYHDKY
ncbi:MAG: TFIIB-type zinc finger domain-containing protein [Bacteroidales bacterium]|nr:TFIIB-type zinc finger domain-containing protein [Bacteroidales bacterium]